MFYIITKRNCEMCKKALSYLQLKSIVYKEINVDATIIPLELMRAMESILIDEKSQTFASLKSFIRYKAPYFKEHNIEPILLSKEDIRRVISTNPKEVLSFPIILMLGENGITNYVVGFSSVVLDRWVEEPWTKGNFFNINRAYGDFYCCHECFEKEEKLSKGDNYNSQAARDEQKTEMRKNKFKLQIEKWKKTNQENNKFFDVHNNIQNRKNSFEQERERIFGVAEGFNGAHPSLINQQNQQHLNWNIHSQQMQSHRQDLTSLNGGRTFQNQYEQIPIPRANLYSNSANQYNVVDRKPIYIKENIIHAQNMNGLDVNNNKPRIYGEIPIVNRNKIIDDLEQSHLLNNSMEDLASINNLNKKQILANNKAIAAKILENNLPILQRIGLGEEIGQPEFSVFNQKITTHAGIIKTKARINSSSIDEFLDEINIILNNSESEKGNINDKKLVDHGVLNHTKNTSFSYADEFKIPTIEEEPLRAAVANLSIETEVDLKDKNHYPFEKSIIDSLKNDEFIFENEPEVILDKIEVFEQIKSNKPRLFNDTSHSFKIKDSEVALKWSGYDEQLNQTKKNSLFDKIDIDENKYISSFDDTSSFEISEEEIYAMNRKLLEASEANYDIFTEFENIDNHNKSTWENVNNYENKKGNNK